jgi:hypothetical protein
MVLPTFISLVVEFVGGLLLLFFGKELFYFFIAIAGFTLGYLASILLLGPFGWPGLIISLLLAAIAVGLAFLARHLLVRLAGTLVGALTAGVVYSLLGGLLTDLLGVSSSFLLLPCLIVVGGVAGFLLSLRAFDLALMVLSSLLGADAVATALQTTLALPSLFVTPVIVCLFLAGLAYQSGLFSGPREQTRSTQL